jgi:hypothetical protein
MSSAREAGWRILDAVRATVAYADVFGFAVNPAEVHRDLVGVVATVSEVQAAIDGAIESGEFAFDQGYVTLVERKFLVDQRIARNQARERLWSAAKTFGAILASLPFVRMVGVTGSLAADNAAADADIDYLLIVAPDRLWFVRALAIGVVRVARLSGVTLCPNYVLTTRALCFPHHDLYTAHELLQMVPLAGPETYAALRSANRWVDDFLPCRSRLTRVIPPAGGISARLKWLTERTFGGSLGAQLNAWESRRKIARFRAVGSPGRFTHDVCEGHFGHHRDKILREWRSRCGRLGVSIDATSADQGSAELVAAFNTPRRA